MKLLEWQEKVVHGTELSLAVPAGARTGKNVATVFAMKEKPTLAIVPSLSHRRCLEREIRNRVGHIGIMDIVTSKEFFENEYVKSFTANHEQIVFNELYGVELMDLLQLRDRFNGRIVVMGTPLRIPCPIFYPLSKMKGWGFLNVNEYKTAVDREFFKPLEKRTPYSLVKTELEGAFV